MATQQIRLSKALIEDAERQGAVEHRASAKQIEYWASLGKMLSRKLRPEDVLSLMQGFTEIRLDAVRPASADMDDVLSALEADRQAGGLAASIKTAPFRYGINAKNGEIGVFGENGKVAEMPAFNASGSADE